MVSALALGLALLAQPKAVAKLLDGVDSLAIHQGFSGVISVANGRDFEFTRAYGMADQEHAVFNHEETKFVTASVAQTFIAVAVAMLVKDGAVALDAPLSRYLPDSVYPRERADHMTIRQLLTHTAGLGPGVVRLPEFRAAPQSFTRFDQILALIRAQPLVGDTGRFVYSGADCDLLAAVIDRVSRHGFEDYMRKHVFVYGLMANTGFDFSTRPESLAHGNDAILPRIGVPEAVAYTTAVDLMRFGLGLLDEPFPGLFTDTVSTGQDGPNHAYGYGFFVGRAGPNRIYNHGGTGPRIDNAFDLYPDLHLVVVIVSNQDPPAAQHIREYLRDGLASVAQR